MAPKEFSSQILLKKKTKGGLIYPSQDVVRICEKAKSILQSTLKESNAHCLAKRFSETYLLNIVLKNFLFDNHKLFKNLKQHARDQNHLQNHVLHLIRAIIAAKYSKVWASYCCSQATNKSKVFVNILIIWYILRDNNMMYFLYSEINSYVVMYTSILCFFCQYSDDFTFHP